MTLIRAALLNSLGGSTSSLPAPSITATPGERSNNIHFTTLTNPTVAEKLRTWTATHPQWGGALSLQGYVDREQHLTTIPLARNGGLTQWILVDRDSDTTLEDAGTKNRTQPVSRDDASDQLHPNTIKRAILSSCDALTKKVLVRSSINSISSTSPNISASRDGDGVCGDDSQGDSIVAEGTAHAIGSVFTPADHRGRGYAQQMLRKLGDTYQGMNDSEPGSATCSVLYSDIGKQFYARVGWKAFESTHLEFQASPPPPTPSGSSELAGGSNDAQGTSDSIKLLGYEDVAELTARDVQLVRAQLESHITDKKIVVALLPDEESTLWFLHREDFMCKQIFSRTASVRGAMYTVPPSPSSSSSTDAVAAGDTTNGADGGPAFSSTGTGVTQMTTRRIWAFWYRAFYGGAEHPEKNTLYFLRLAVEDEANLSDDQLAEGVRQIVQRAQDEAGKWLCRNVEIWNPSRRVREIVLNMKDLGGCFVDREGDSITSLRWFGDGDIEDVEWIANEKFGWC